LEAGRAMMRLLLLNVFAFGTIALAQAGGEQVAQHPSADAELKFDVVAIHPSPPDAKGGFIKPLPNGSGYQAENMTAKTMMALMYRIPERQIEGGPEWFGTEPFNVEARADHGGYSIDDLHAMFKTLLKDRFGLKIHVDTREGPVYVLTVARGGIKMKDHGALGDLSIPIVPRGHDQFVGTKVPMQYLCWFLEGIMPENPRPIIDETGLKDVYDFELSFAPELPPGISVDQLTPEMRNRPVLRDALEEQLGLELKQGKGPVDYYVIDRVSEPSAN
jgi:uncharacterized protein (TIGR03435 family)